MTRTMRAVAALALVMAAGEAPAQDATVAPDATVAGVPSRAALALELNDVRSFENGCRLSVLVENRLGAEIEDLIVEVAVFGADGGLDRLLRLGFGPLPAGKTRIRQFDLAEVGCDGVARVLVNDVATCTGDGVTPLACLRAMTARSTTSVAFGL